MFPQLLVLFIARTAANPFLILRNASPLKLKGLETPLSTLSCCILSQYAHFFLMLFIFLRSCLMMFFFSFFSFSSCFPMFVLIFCPFVYIFFLLVRLCFCLCSCCFLSSSFSSSLLFSLLLKLGALLFCSSYSLCSSSFFFFLLFFPFFPFFLLFSSSHSITLFLLIVEPLSLTNEINYLFQDLQIVLCCN